MTLLLYDVFSAFFLGPCILARYFVFTGDVQTLIIVYMTFVVYGYCLWLCVWICVYGCVYGCVWMYGFTFMAMCMGMYGYRVSILREAWFNEYRGLPLLGARFHHHWDLFLYGAYFGDFWDLLLHEAHFYHHRVLILHEARFSKFWDLLLYEAHLYCHRVLLLHEARFSKFRDLFLYEAHLDDSSNFSNFSLTKNGKIYPSK
jgi:hypothetical protein